MRASERWASVYAGIFLWYRKTPSSFGLFFLYEQKQKKYYFP